MSGSTDAKSPPITDWPRSHRREGSSREEGAYVEFEGVSKSYDGRTMVVGNFDLSVRKGEFLTLLGPSGSGKTTCLMMLAGFEVPTSGAIRIDGRSVHALPPRKRGIGMVFQNYALFPHMTVGRNLAFPSKCAGSTASRAGTEWSGPCSWYASKASRTGGRRSCPGGNSSAWRSPGR